MSLVASRHVRFYEILSWKFLWKISENFMKFLKILYVEWTYDDFIINYMY